MFTDIMKGLKRLRSEEVNDFWHAARGGGVVSALVQSYAVLIFNNIIYNVNVIIYNVNVNVY